MCRKGLVFAGGYGLMLVFPAASAWGQQCGILRACDGPSPRQNFAMGYDDTEGVTLLFGGFDGVSNSGETWAWDGSVWELQSRVGPSPRREPVIAESANGILVLFGGFDGASNYGDTWEWDPQTGWSQVSDTGPSPRRGHAMAYDGDRHTTVLFGGYDSAGYDGETWEWDGTTWTQKCGGCLPGETTPSPRRGHAMAYDGVNHVTVLFGGYDGSHYGDTWEWDGSVWTKASDNGPTRYNHAMIYDTTERVVTLFGGFDGFRLLADRWEWDGNNWTLGCTGNAPRPRNAHGMSYERNRTAMVVFGGFDQEGPGGVDGETWALDGGGCNGSESLKASCREKDNNEPPEGDDLVKAKLTNGTPGQPYTFRIDGGPCTTKAANDRGVAKTKWSSVDDGSHTVTVVECGLEKSTSCP